MTVIARLFSVAFCRTYKEMDLLTTLKKKRFSKVDGQYIFHKLIFLLGVCFLGFSHHCQLSWNKRGCIFSALKRYLCSLYVYFGLTRRKLMKTKDTHCMSYLVPYVSFLSCVFRSAVWASIYSFRVHALSIFNICMCTYKVLRVHTSIQSSWNWSMAPFGQLRYIACCTRTAAR